MIAAPSSSVRSISSRCRRYVAFLEDCIFSASPDMSPCILPLSFSQTNEGVYYHADALLKSLYAAYVPEWRRAFGSKHFLVLRAEDYWADRGAPVRPRQSVYWDRSQSPRCGYLVHRLSLHVDFSSRYRSRSYFCSLSHAGSTLSRVFAFLGLSPPSDSQLHTMVTGPITPIHGSNAKISTLTHSF